MDSVTHKQQVLIVDDSPQICFSIRDACRNMGWLTCTASSCHETLRLLAISRIDVVVLDRVLPDGDGAEWIRDIHDVSPESCVLLLSQKSTVDHRIFGLQHDADDYLGKPFSMDELLLRIQHLLYTRHISNNHSKQFGAVMVRDEEYTCQYQGKVLLLTKKEFEVFRFLLERHDTVVQKAVLARHVWPLERYPSSSAIEACIKRIRRALIGTTISIKTKYRIGYMLVLNTS